MKTKNDIKIGQIRCYEHDEEKHYIIVSKAGRGLYRVLLFKPWSHYSICLLYIWPKGVIFKDKIVR